MGMDGVEIVMDVEDHFGISIQDSEAEHVRAVGDLVALVQARIAAAQREYCPTLTAFLSLRNAARVVLGDDSVHLRPRDAVANILAPTQRRALWKQLPALMGTSPRPLRRPALLRRSLAAISIAVLLLALFSALTIDFQTLPLTIIVAAGVIVVLHYLTIPLRSIPPVGWMTFGEITTEMVGLKVATKMVHLRSDDEILNELRPLLVNVLGVDGAEIVPAARFVEDLGMD